jgi:hypothetical protein
VREQNSYRDTTPHPLTTSLLHQSAWYPVVAEPDTNNFTTEPAAIKPSNYHQSIDDASLQQLVRDPELTTTETWLAFLTALGAVIALDIGSSPQIIIIILIGPSPITSQTL